MKNRVGQKTIFLFTGIFATMPIVTISVGDKLVSIFSILFGLLYISTFWMAIRKNRGLWLNSESIALAMWFLLSLLASIMGAIYFSGDIIWFNQSLSYVPKIFLYFTLLLFAMKLDNQNHLVANFLNGFIIGCLLNLIWSVIEGFSFYVFGIALNDVVFSEFAKTLPEERPYITIVADGIIRASGFNFDPAHLGGIIPIIFIYSILKRNLYILILALASLVFSGSTTALVSCVLAVLISIGKVNIFKALVTTSNTRNKGVSLILIIFSLTLIVSNGQVRESIYKNVVGFYNRVNETYVDNGDQGPRYVYHAYLPQAMSNSGFRLLTGTGFGTASHSFVSDPEIIKILDAESYYPYDPESTYISYLFDIGIVGLLFYVYILTSLLLGYRRRLSFGNVEIIIYSSLCGIIFSGFSYHYTLAAYQVLILVFAVVAKNWSVDINRVKQ